jgi:hypothetical protein
MKNICRYSKQLRNNLRNIFRLPFALPGFMSNLATQRARIYQSLDESFAEYGNVIIMMLR